jgi:hypothetical protein
VAGVDNKLRNKSRKVVIKGKEKERENLFRVIKLEREINNLNPATNHIGSRII